MREFTPRRGFARLLSIVLLAGTLGCENIALIGRATPEIDGDDIVGEITGIDRRQNQIFLRSTDERARGRSANRVIHYDDTTQVVYRGRDYSINALEVGDLVALQIWQRDRGTFTNLIRLQQSRRER